MNKHSASESAPVRIRNRATWLISRTHVRSHGLLSDGFAESGTGLRSYHYRLLAALEEWGSGEPGRPRQEHRRRP
jgi:hypothetical protein